MDTELACVCVCLCQANHLAHSTQPRRNTAPPQQPSGSRKWIEKECGQRPPGPCRNRWRHKGKPGLRQAGLRCRMRSPVGSKSITKLATLYSAHRSAVSTARLSKQRRVPTPAHCAHLSAQHAALSAERGVPTQKGLLAEQQAPPEAPGLSS